MSRSGNGSGGGGTQFGRRPDSVSSPVDTGSGVAAGKLGLPAAKGSRVDPESQAVTDATKTSTAGVYFTPGSISILSKLDRETQIKANADARALKDPITIEDSKFRTGFLKRVGEAAVKRGITSDSDYSALMQEMFNTEILKHAHDIQKEALIKAEKDAEEKEAARIKKAAESKKAAQEKGVAYDEKLARNKNFHRASGASTVVGAVESVASLGASVPAAIFKFLNENAPEGHGNEFLLMIKLCEAFAMLIKLPFDALKGVLDSWAIKNATPEQAKAYKEYMSAKPEERANKLKSLDSVSTKSFTDLAAEKRSRDAAEVATSGDLNTGIGNHGPQ